VLLEITPEPTPEEADAIAAALASPTALELGRWAETALAEGVEDEREP
jgi:hypothetical protein